MCVVVGRHAAKIVMLDDTADRTSGGLDRAVGGLYLRVSEEAARATAELRRGDPAGRLGNSGRSGAFPDFIIPGGDDRERGSEEEIGPVRPIQGAAET